MNFAIRERLVQATYVSTKSKDSNLVWLFNPEEPIEGVGKGEAETCLKPVPMEEMLWIDNLGGAPLLRTGLIPCKWHIKSLALACISMDGLDDSALECRTFSSNTILDSIVGKVQVTGHSSLTPRDPILSKRSKSTSSFFSPFLWIEFGRETKPNLRK